MQAIKVTKLSKAYGGKPALKDVGLTVEEGEIYGFLGPNGAGKTTTIRCMMDFIRADSGSITILGEDSRRDSASLKHKVGYLSSDLQLHGNWTGKTHLDFLSSIKGGGRSRELIKLLEIDTGKRVSELSSGNKQKLAIALAFLGSPRVLIMDEPTRGLDPLLQNQLYQLLRGFAAEGGTVFLSSHNLSEVQEICDRVAVIKEGIIVAAEAMDDILQAKLLTVKATASRVFNLKDLKLPNVELLHHQGNTITFKVRGDINPVIKTLATYHLTDIEINHANLEDVFMEHYS